MSPFVNWFSCVALWTQHGVNARRSEAYWQNTRFYLRDCADHAAHILDIVESYRDMSVAVMELPISTRNRQLNEAMLMLNMIATIFIALSFVVGIYGMKFDPEVSPWSMAVLSWQFGYTMILLMLLSIGLGILTVFKRKGWF